MLIDAHHHLWDLKAVHYPWLLAKGEVRFFGDPAPIQRDYLLDEFRRDAEATGFGASVHIQVGATDAWAEAVWVDKVANENPDWPLRQVAFCNLINTDREQQLDRLQTLKSVIGIRQIVGRAPGEDAATGTNTLLENPEFLSGLKSLAARGLSFDLQLLPELIAPMARLLEQVPDLKVALCHAGSPYDRSVSGVGYWREQLSLLAALPAVVCKLSGLGMFDHHWKTKDFRPLVESCLELFTTKRCLFGSNFPVDSLSSDYRRLVQAYRELVSHSEHQAIFGDNAKNFYRL